MTKHPIPLLAAILAKAMRQLRLFDLRPEKRLVHRRSGEIHTQTFHVRPEEPTAQPRTAENAAAEYKRLGVRSRAFKVWFGDWEHDPAHSSKVVNAKGEPAEAYSVQSSKVVRDSKPVVVYHGTAHKGFRAFDKAKQDKTGLYGPGFYFTESVDVAKEYEGKGASYELLQPYETLRTDFMAAARKHPIPAWAKRGGEEHYYGQMEGMLAYPNDRGWKGDDAEQVISQLKEWELNPDKYLRRRSTSETKAAYLNIRKPLDMDATPDKTFLDHIGEAAKRLWNLKEGNVDAQLAQWKKNSIAFKKEDLDTSRGETLMSHALSDLLECNAVWEAYSGAKNAGRALYGWQYQDLLSFAGYDGIMHMGGSIMGDKRHRVWIAFESRQIKAVENEGTFDPADIDIYKALMPGESEQSEQNVGHKTRRKPGGQHVRYQGIDEMAKAFVRGHQKISQKTGKPIQVQSYYTKRILAAREEEAAARGKRHVRVTVAELERRMEEYEAAFDQIEAAHHKAILEHQGNKGKWARHTRQEIDRNFGAQKMRMQNEYQQLEADLAQRKQWEKRKEQRAEQPRAAKVPEKIEATAQDAEARGDHEQAREIRAIPSATAADAAFGAMVATMAKKGLGESAAKLLQKQGLTGFRQRAASGKLAPGTPAGIQFKHRMGMSAKEWLAKNAPSAERTEKVEKPESVASVLQEASTEHVSTPAEKPATAEKSQAKEPWEMTREEFVRHSFISPVKNADGSIDKRYADISWGGEIIRTNVRGRESKPDIHAVVIGNALDEGKPVPAEVLKDYPDLAQEHKQFTMDYKPEAGDVRTVAHVLRGEPSAAETMESREPWDTEEYAHINPDMRKWAWWRKQLAEKVAGKDPLELSKDEFIGLDKPPAFMHDAMDAIKKKNPEFRYNDFAETYPPEIRDKLLAAEKASIEHRKTHEALSQKLVAALARRYPEKKTGINMGLAQPQYTEHAHKLMLQYALEDGEKVSANALKDYPDLIAKLPATPTGPQPGEQKVNVAGNTLVLRGGRWHRVEQKAKAEEKPAAAKPEPDTERRQSVPSADKTEQPKSAGPKPDRTRKGTYYWKLRASAEAWAKENGWPTNRIINYEVGYAVQSSPGGAYAGPDKISPGTSVPTEQSNRIDQAVEPETVAGVLQVQVPPKERRSDDRDKRAIQERQTATDEEHARVLGLTAKQLLAERPSPSVDLRMQQLAAKLLPGVRLGESRNVIAHKEHDDPVIWQRFVQSLFDEGRARIGDAGELPTIQDGLREGDTSVSVADNLLVLRDGRWHRMTPDVKKESVATVLGQEPPAKPSTPRLVTDGVTTGEVLGNIKLGSKQGYRIRITSGPHAGRQTSVLSSMFRDVKAEQAPAAVPYVPQAPASENQAVAVARAETKLRQTEAPKPLSPTKVPAEGISPNAQAQADVLASILGMPDPPDFAKGETLAASTDMKRMYKLRHRVVELGSLIASHTATGEENPAYNQELQPRARGRKASREWIDKTTSEFSPFAVLGDFHSVEKGSPVIGGDMQVESGNGRVLVLSQVVGKPEMWVDYQRALRSLLPFLGLQENALTGIKNPVLVRERITGGLDIEVRKQFANDANYPVAAKMSTLEQAKADAKLLDAGLVKMLDVQEEESVDQALRRAGNAGFVRAFIQQLPQNDAGSLLDSDGMLARAGISRVKGALYAHAFPGEAGAKIAATVLEAVDSSVLNFESALSATLPTLAVTESSMREGTRPPLSLAEDFAAAIKKMNSLKQQGMKIRDYVLQRNMAETGALASATTPLQQAIMLEFESRAKSPKKLRHLFTTYARLIDQQGNPNQRGMFASIGPKQIARKQELWDEMLESIKREQPAETVATILQAA